MVAQNKVLPILQNKKNLAYIENNGQWDNRVSFLTRIKGADAWILRDGGMLLDFYKLTHSTISNVDNFKIGKLTKNDSIKGHRIYFKWMDSNSHLTFIKLKKHPEYYNYLLSQDGSKHASNVGLYDELVAENLYHGINIRYYYSNSTLRYDLILKPHADPSQIKIQLIGTKNISKDNKGNIILQTSVGEMSMQELYVYEKESHKQIDCKWVIKNNELTLSIGAYNKSSTLIIDPLIYSTYLGGNNYEYSHDISVNSSGEAFITGSSQSANFDFTPGSYQTSFNGIWDAFISKINATGTSLLFSTFIGGSSSEQSRSISIDGSGNSYITGYTLSSDFNVTSGAFQTSQSTLYTADVFVTKLNTTGTALIYSTYIGGNNDDQGFAITLDNQNNAYVTGWTASTDYDVSPGAYQLTKSVGIYDAFITKLNPTGSALIYSTHLGGTSDEGGVGIIVDSLYNAYVTGNTYSPDFDVTPGAYQTTLNTPSNFLNDAFVTKINAPGTSLLFSTYVGGSGQDAGVNLALDQSGYIYVAGHSTSLDFPVTLGCIQSVQGSIGTYTDCFILKFNPTANSLLFSTYIGGTSEDRLSDIILDLNNDIYITGQTASPNYYVTPGAFQTSFTSLSNSDAFITKIDNSGSTILYSSFFGGSYDQIGYGLALDPSGKIYFTGNTSSTNFPVTAGAYQTSLQGTDYDAFVAKIGICSSINFSITASNVSCHGNHDGIAVTILPGSSAGFNYNWEPLSISSASVSNLAPGNYSMTITDDIGCSTTKTITISEPAPVVASLTGPSATCSSQNVVLFASGGNSYVWSTGATSPTIILTPTMTTSYSVVVSTGSCSDSTSITLNVMPSPVAAISGIDSICQGQSTLLTISGGTNVAWSNGLATNSISVNPVITTPYSAIISNASCSDTAFFAVTVMPDPLAYITGTDSICIGQSTTITANGGGSYHWSTGSTNPSIAISPTTNTTYSVLVSTMFGCKDTAFINLIIVAMPFVSITGNTVVCSSDLLTLTANGIGNYLWDTNEITSSIHVSPNNTTVYHVTASNMCGIAFDSISILVKPLPDATVSHDTTLLLENTATLMAYGGSSYNWLPPGLSCNTCSVVTVSPLATTIYTITITGSNGCAIKKNITVNVESHSDIFVPDIFSPNNDGYNDVLYVRGIGIQELTFKLYDRLGEKLFETHDPKIGWDGTYQGNLLNNAVFVYELHVTLVNGSKINKQGDVTLIR